MIIFLSFLIILFITTFLYQIIGGSTTLTHDLDLYREGLFFSSSAALLFLIVFGFVCMIVGVLAKMVHTYGLEAWGAFKSKDILVLLLFAPLYMLLSMLSILYSLIAVVFSLTMIYVGFTTRESDILNIRAQTKRVRGVFPLLKKINNPNWIWLKFDRNSLAGKVTRMLRYAGLGTSLLVIIGMFIFFG